MLKSSWKKVTLKDYDTVPAIYHSPLLTASIIYDNVKINYQNATGYVLQISSGLIDICTHLRQSNHLSFEVDRCLAIVGVIFLVFETVCTNFANEENYEDHETRWLSYCSAISLAFDGLLLFTSH
ncbi:unnamed protein product [Rotaria sp. Silwood2]|nr:unnamed protein product [Rotaria sp. Silwood2]CAF3090936.1 unnamed protein product [Rotaria sp. Silwood2]CAF3409975.1 unnamed protein product [Rotaria sp. Silwood2]CAF4087460.1 unnamed protein product [Rotaria sp. Silwood2]CAF4126700.1 unnamed protein product [Rotaria sp. Silwood2]